MLNNPRIFPGLSYYKQAGTNPHEDWIILANLFANAPSTNTFTINVLHAVPFVSGGGMDLDRLAFEVTITAANSKARCGIYTCVSEDNLYPDTLVVDGGEHDTSAVGGVGVKASTIATVLKPNTVYFVAYLCGTAAPRIRVSNGAGQTNLLGYSSAMGAVSNVRLTVAQAYGALPTTFPSGAAIQTAGTDPNIYARLSA